MPSNITMLWRIPKNTPPTSTHNVRTFVWVLLPANDAYGLFISRSPFFVFLNLKCLHTRILFSLPDRKTVLFRYRHFADQPCLEELPRFSLLRKWVKTSATTEKDQRDVGDVRKLHRLSPTWTQVTDCRRPSDNRQTTSDEDTYIACRQQQGSRAPHKIHI